MHPYIRRFKRSQEGLAYLEFALILPLLLTLFLGAVEMTRFILITQKLEKISSTVSDLVAQSSTATTGELSILIQAASQVMQPFSFSADGYIVISSVTKTGSNQPVVNWQYAGGGTWTHASQIGVQGGTATLPSGFTMIDKDNVIIAEVFYNYQPMLGTLVGNVVTSHDMYRMSIYKPRLGDLKVLGWYIPLAKEAMS